MSNKFNLTIISFLSYYLTGSIIVVTGITVYSISEYFKISVSYTSNLFTFLNAGILISIFFNTFIAKFFSIKQQINIGFILIIFSIIGFITSKNLIIFCINLFLLGIVGGLTISIGTFLITSLYNGSERTKKILLTDSFFSMSGMIFPVIITYLLNNNIIWYWIYIIIGIIYSIIFIISTYVKFPKEQQKSQIYTQKNNQHKTNAIILCISALCYILGQLGFIAWVPEYIIQNIGLSLQFSNKIISNFWMSYMIGMWCFSYILQFIDLQKSILILSGIATILMSLFIFNKSIILFNIIIILLGFFSSAIYSIIITLTSLQTKIPSRKLINLTLTSGTIGTLLTFVITSPIVSIFGVKTTLIFSNILYSIVFMLCYILGYFSNHKKYF